MGVRWSLQELWCGISTDSGRMRYLRVDYVAQRNGDGTPQENKRLYNALGSMDNPVHVRDYVDIGRKLCQQYSKGLDAFCENLPRRSPQKVRHWLAIAVQAPSVPPQLRLLSCWRDEAYSAEYPV